MKKEMLINVLQPEECRIAIVEDGVLEELYVERTSHESYTGNIYKGKIVNLEPAIQAAFVDFSVGRNGFLHVSDVEPQYYHRHLDADAPTPRDRDREGGRRDTRRPPPPRAEDHDRPDRMEKPRPRRERPDRSEKPRRPRFGEGLLGDDSPAPPPFPPAPRLPEPVREAPARLDREEPPRRPRFEPTSPPRVEEPPYGRLPDRDREREQDARPPVEPQAPRGPSFRDPEPIDPDLPPSRTQRSRPPYSPPRPAAGVENEPGRARLPASPFEPESTTESPTRERDRERDPRRGRGRGRAPRPAEPDSLFAPAEPEVKAPEPLAENEPEFGSRTDAPRHRAGRAAIRSRGGEREPERPRERPPLPSSPAPAEPEPERFRPLERERSRGFEPEPPRERERPRAAEPESPRERERKLHDRAGEPGYVPRRERSRAPEPSFGAETESDADADAGEWVDLGPEGETETDADAPAGEGLGKFDGPRRRRRRRGRRRERTELEGETAAAGDLDADLDDDELEPSPAPVREAPSVQRGPKPLVEDEDELDREFDFGDESAEDAPRGLDVDDDDLGDTDEIEPRVSSPEDNELDPGLEEEIRREIEEIAELEREMGLRGTTEARPRRGDDREPDAGARGPGGRPARGRGMVKPPLQEIFRRGDEVLVQVIKESIGTKGPTLSTYISIPGRYLVLMPGLNRVGVSRKIADEGQRRKLRDIMNDLNPPKGLGFIVRTAGLERTKRELARDLAYLLRLWKVILRRIKKSRTPAPIYQESDMITRTIRDIFSAEIDTIWIDEPQAFERAQEFLRVVMPKFVDRLKLYDERVPLFHKYGIEDEIAKIQRRRVDLPEGGSIVIDQTEALVAIDVNSGNFRVENDAERTAYEMNLRAAKEIARQLRLRDLGGVIVNDFIDMRDERHRRGVEKALRDAIKRDRARTKVLRMSTFGLIEMTRQRIRPSLKRSVYEDCPNCAGAGVVKTVESMSIDVVRLLALASHREDIRRVNVSVSTPVATHLNNRKRREITRLETEFNMTIHIRPEDHVPAEHLQIDCFDGNNGEIRLLPAPNPSGPGHRRPPGH